LARRAACGAPQSQAKDLKQIIGVDDFARAAIREFQSGSSVGNIAELARHAPAA